MFRCVAKVLAVAILMAFAGAGVAQAQVQPYGTNDYGGFHDVLPPGTNGFDDLAQLAGFEANGTRPEHSSDQFGMYNALTLGGGQRHRRQPLQLLQGRRRSGSQPGDVESTAEPGGGRHDRSRQTVRGAAHLRRHPAGADVRDRLRDGRGPAVLHRRAAPRRRGRSRRVRRRRQRRQWTNRSGRTSPTPIRTSSTRSTTSTTSPAAPSSIRTRPTTSTASTPTSRRPSSR